MKKMNSEFFLFQQFSCLLKAFHSLKVGLLIGCLAWLSACAANSVVPISNIYQSQHCAIEQAQLIFLDNPVQLAGFMENARRFNLNSGKIASVSLPASARAIVVAIGKRPNSGYRLELTDRYARIDGDTLKLPLRFIEPAAENMHAQMVSSPCIVIAINIQERYRQVQAGGLSAETP